MKHLYLFMLFLAGIAQNAMSQTMTGTLVQPCNNDGVYSVTTSGIPLPITYTYHVNGTTIVHANVNSATDQLTNIALTDYDYLYCTASNGSVSASAGDWFVSPFSFQISGTSPVCPATTGTLTANQTSGTTGPFTYSWTNTQTLATYSGNNATVPLGEYAAEITDQTTGCVLQIHDTLLTIEQLSSITADITTTPANCTNGTAAAVAANGVAPYSYLWVNGATTATITGLGQGYYPLVVTDAQGCQSSYLGAYIEQTIQIPVNTTVTNAACLQTNGSAIAFASGGMNPYTYAWTNGQTGNTVSGLPGGTTYSVMATDANGCTGMGYASINTSTPITVTYFSSPSQCSTPTGSATLIVSGGTEPYTYSWSFNTSVTGPTITNVAPGTYAFLVTDAAGCIRTGSVVVAPVSAIYTTTQSSAAICPSTTGTVTVNATGTNGPFSYLWSNGATTSTVTGVPFGTHSFLVTDAVGCTRTGSVIVEQVSPIYAGIQASAVVCPATTGTVTVNASGMYAPFSYLWSNGATTSSISGVPIGSYSCVITDGMGCSVTKSALLTPISPVNVAVSPVPVTCVYANDGSATGFANGGTAPYTYSYSNGATTQTANSLITGNYYLIVTDANGCSQSTEFSIQNANTSDDCYCTISGNVYVDANANCVHDGGENGVENIMIHCSGFGYGFTDANGHYSFKVPTGTYTISEQVNQYYPLSACQNNSNTVSVVAASGCTTSVDFANTIDPIHDLKIVTVNSQAPPIPGNNYQQLVIVRNEGTITESGVQLGYETDGQLPLVNAGQLGFVQLNTTTYPNWYSVQTTFPALVPNSNHVMLVNYATPTSIPLGTVVDFYDTVAHVAPIGVNWMLDYTPWNNVNTFQPAVVSSYDPNYKEVSPAGEGPQGNVPGETKEFDYTIHFQNEGTYFAQNISVTDQLDADFDWTTLNPGYSEYPYTTTVSETGLVTFTFANINLPWKSAYGDALSSSLIQYSIQRKATTPVGTEFTNTANIYFDYNAPITTNTTLNTLQENVAGIDEVSIGNGVTVDLYPVPVSDQLTIRVNNVSKSEAATVLIVDLTGHVVMTDTVDLGEGSTVVTKNLSQLVPGTYLARIQFENGSSVTKKIVVCNN